MSGGFILIDELNALLQADGTYGRNTVTGPLNIDVFITSCKYRLFRAGWTYIYDRQGIYTGRKERYETEWSVSGSLRFGDRDLGAFGHSYTGSKSRELYRQTARLILLSLVPFKQRVYMSTDPGTFIIKSA